MHFSSFPVSLSALSDDDVKALTELFRLGLGHAENSLSRLGQTAINLTGTEVGKVVDGHYGLFVDAPAGPPAYGISQRFRGPVSGFSLLVFTESEFLKLLKGLNGALHAADPGSEVVLDGLRELGNIILSACISNVAGLFDNEIATEPPKDFSGNPRNLPVARQPLQSLAPWQYLKVGFSVNAQCQAGFIVLVMDAHSTKTLKRQLTHLLAHS